MSTAALEEPCHHPGKGGRAWQGHGPSRGWGGTMGGCGGGFEDKWDVFWEGVMFAWGQRGHGHSVRGEMMDLDIRMDAVVMMAVLGRAGTELEGVIVALGTAGIWWGCVRAALGTEGKEWEGLMVILGMVGTQRGHRMVALGTGKTEQEGVMVALGTHTRRCGGGFGDSGDSQEGAMVALGTERTQQEQMTVIWGQ